MSKITINGNVYDYPDAGRENGWGEDGSQAFYELVSIVASLTGNGYISESTVQLSNNQTTLSDVPSLQFNSSLTTTASVKYLLIIDYTTATITEDGILNLIYDAESSSWKLQREFNGTASEVFFDITTSGQIQYTSPNYEAAPYSGTFVSAEMKFKTASLFQA